MRKRAKRQEAKVSDDVDELDGTSQLFHLLRHYAELGLADRETWQDRLMNLADAETRDLSRLHGELIAQGWVEQNTGATAVIKPGVAAACYRITTHGLRAFKAALN